MKETAKQLIHWVTNILHKTVVLLIEVVSRDSGFDTLTEWSFQSVLRLGRRSRKKNKLDGGVY